MSNPNKIFLPLVEYEYKDGEWLWKALAPKPLVRKKSETPQLKCCDGIESANKKEFDKAIGNAARDIVRYLV